MPSGVILPAFITSDPCHINGLDIIFINFCTNLKFHHYLHEERMLRREPTVPREPAVPRFLA